MLLKVKPNFLLIIKTTMPNYSFLKTASMKKLFLLLPILLLAMFSFAQQKTITGTVTGKADKVSLAGVSVQTKNKTVLTDASGKFSIEASSGDNLTFSYVGMKPLTIPITNSTENLIVELEEGVKMGEEL